MKMITPNKRFLFIFILLGFFVLTACQIQYDTNVGKWAVKINPTEALTVAYKVMEYYGTSTRGESIMSNVPLRLETEHLIVVINSNDVPVDAGGKALFRFSSDEAKSLADNIIKKFTARGDGDRILVHETTDKILIIEAEEDNHQDLEVIEDDIDDLESWGN